jgi:AraC-like DNA-binding protein
MLKEFTTDTIRTSRQLRAWREIMSDVYYSVDIMRSEHDLRGRLREVGIGNLSVTRFDSDRQRVLRTRTRIAEGPDDSYVFIMPQREAMYYNQAGRSGHVSPGDYILVSTSEFYELSCPDGFVNYTVKLPGESLRLRIANVDDHLCCRFPMNRDMAQIALALVTKTAATFTRSNSAAHAEAIAKRIEDFIALVIECEDTTTAGQEKRARFLLRQRIARDIRLRIQEPELAPRDIAARAGISLSYLHRIFNEHGTTVSSYIAQQRLNLAYEMLVSPGGVKPTIAEIAYSVGYKSASHFHKAFALRYKLAPGDVRRP